MTAQTELVDQVVDAVLAVPHVTGIHSGGAGAIATYLPGRTVSGIRINDDGGEVNIVVEFEPGADLIGIAEQARAAASKAASVPVNVVVSDIIAPHQSKEITA